MKYIRSTKNENVKRWKKLLKKKEREKTGLFLIEGRHLVEEALETGIIAELIMTEAYYESVPDFNSGESLYIVSEEIAKVISDTETPQGIFAVCRQMEDASVSGKRFLLLDAVQDPGNLGTLIRTADSAGLDAVIVGEGSADIYNSKVLRAAQGSHFHLPVVRGNLHDWIERLNKMTIPVFGTAVKKGVPMYGVAPQKAFALIVGNEGQGVSEEDLQKAEKNLYIPIYGKNESLNVSVATGILLYYLRGNLV